MTEPASGCDLAAIRARLQQTMPEPEATRWRYETTLALCGEVERLTAENARLRDRLFDIEQNGPSNTDVLRDVGLHRMAALIDALRKDGRRTMRVEETT